jgi:hypothetical protein
MKKPTRLFGGAPAEVVEKRKPASFYANAPKSSSAPPTCPGGLFALPKDFVEQMQRHRLMYCRPGDNCSIH